MSACSIFNLKGIDNDNAPSQKLSMSVPFRSTIGSSISYQCSANQVVVYFDAFHQHGPAVEPRGRQNTINLAGTLFQGAYLMEITTVESPVKVNAVARTVGPSLCAGNDILTLLQ